MHEGLITRGMVQGSGKEDLIVSRYNCLIVHPRCHNKIVGSGGSKWFEISALHLIEKEGREEVREWLVQMTVEFKEIAIEILRRFDRLQ